MNSQNWEMILGKFDLKDLPEITEVILDFPVPHAWFKPPLSSAAEAG